MTQPDLNAAIRDIPRPAEVARLPIDARGFVVPWFVDCGPAGDAPDHRLVDGHKFARSVREQRCWVCGGKLGRVKASVIGPMCAVNRITSEPASHPMCARYAVQACPFLSRPRARRNEKNLPEGRREAAGIALDRNPGVSVIWSSLYPSKPFRPQHGTAGILFELGPPYAVSWWREGREATRAECIESLEAGLPALVEIALQEGQAAMLALAQATRKAMKLLPSEPQGVAAEQPEQDQDHDHHADDPEPAVGSPGAVAVPPAAAAKDQQHDEDKQDQADAHLKPSQAPLGG